LPGNEIRIETNVYTVCNEEGRHWDSVTIDVKFVSAGVYRKPSEWSVKRKWRASKRPSPLRMLENRME